MSEYHIQQASPFHRRFASRQAVVGSFMNAPTAHAAEIFGTLGYDFVVVDEEHAPFDHTTIDLVLLAARASNIAAIVRVPSDDPARIKSCLDRAGDADIHAQRERVDAVPLATMRLEFAYANR